MLASEIINISENLSFYVADENDCNYIERLRRHAYLIFLRKTKKVNKQEYRRVLKLKNKIVSQQTLSWIKRVEPNIR